MELSPEDRQRIYEEEKARIEARTEIEAQQPKPPSIMQQAGRGLKFGCLIIIGGVVLLFAVGSLIEDSDSHHTTSSAPSTPMSSEEALKRGCQVVRVQYGSKPISELSVDDLQKIKLCQQLGLY
jgi:hypothetical protein